MKRDTLARHLRRHIQGEVRFDATSRRLYSTDASIYQIEPIGVVIPKSVPDMVATVQIAAEMGVPIIPRGGGTSLSGQSIGRGIILDCSKYLNNILAFDASTRTVRIQPGVVLDQLNRFLKPHGLQFGPEVSTSSRANLGGMIGNNSAGSRSIIYGKTIDHVKRLRMILAGGQSVEFGSLTPSEWECRTGLRTPEGNIYRGVEHLVLEHSDEIRRRFPRILRRVSGYNLDAILQNLTDSTQRSLVPLLVGSEGTLAVMTEAELAVLPLPRTRGLLVAHFTSLAAAMDAVAPCLEAQPSAVELLDQLLIDLARENLAARRLMQAIQGRPAALLMIEFSGDDPRDIADRVSRLKRRLEGGAGVSALVPALESHLRDPLWDLRRAAMPLLYGLPGDRKPVTFVEDTAVAPEHLPEFVARFREILQRHGTDGAFYGHASVGCLHIRPLLNLKDRDDVARMRRIMEAISDLVLEYGGALSGEHGDGLVRSEWNRKMFGPEIYEVFRQVKRLFDPEGRLNPGKVVDAPAMTEQLRFGPDYAPTDPPTKFDFSRQGGFVRAVELCNGAGVCRKQQGGAMCPSFRATRDEKDSTRGRANALRHALANPEPLRELRSQWVYEVLDLCLQCKACKAECPSNVDLAKLKAEFLHLYYRHRLRPLAHYAEGAIHWLYPAGAAVAPLVNWIQERALVRWLMEKVGGIDQRRSLPALQRQHFGRWFARHQPNRRAGERGRVLLLDDCFTTYTEPNIGQAAVAVLEAAGYRVERAGIACCGRPLLSKGRLTDARSLIAPQISRLASAVDAGMPILGLEPSCVSALADEWPDLLPGTATRKIASAVTLVESWIGEQIAKDSASLKLKPLAEKVVFHGHCHQMALQGAEGTVAALRLIPELEVQAIHAGCCGMAGAFGYERSHFDLSVAIAQQGILPALTAAPQAIVAATGTSCRHQIKDLAERRAWHPIELLAAQLNDSPVK